MAASCILLLLLRPLNGAALTLEQQPESVIAIVSDVTILRSDIAVDQEEAEFRYKIETGRPVHAAQPGEIETLREKLEVSRLANEIRQIVVQDVKARFEVFVSDAQVTNRWRQLTRGVDLEAAAREQRAQITPLLSALKAVYEQGVDPKKAYDIFLIDEMPFQQWEIQARYYRRPDRRRILEQALEQTAKDLSKPDAGIRAMLEGEQVTQAIDEEIAKADPSFAEYVELLGSNPDDERMHTYPPNYLEQMRAKWWSEQYKDASIEILDERYNKVIDLLVVLSRAPRTIIVEFRERKFARFARSP